MKLKLIRILLLISSFFIFMGLFYRYQKKRKVEKILNEWTRKTNGTIRKDLSNTYEGDYYLTMTSNKDDDTHVHLVVENCDKSAYLCYLIKKYGFHSKSVCIQPHEDEGELVKKMIYDFLNFKP